MDIKPVRTSRDHRAALAEIERLWEAKPGTAEHDRLEVLVTLIESYEAKHHPIPPPDPVEAIRFRMDQMDLDRKDLEDLVGSRARVSEILSGRRGLSLGMIRRLHSRLGIPAEILIGEVRPRPQRRVGSNGRRFAKLKQAAERVRAR
jgi:HTH-type transcriptional regulator/antitoxin HigA